VIDERLNALGPSDPVPRWGDLTKGEKNVEDQLDSAAPEHVAVLAEVLAESWDELGPDLRAELTQRLAARLQIVEDPLAYAAALDRLVPAAAAVGGDTVRRIQSLLIAELAALAANVKPPVDGAARVRFALGSATDLICANVVSPYELLAVLDKLVGSLPTEIASPVARAAGRLAEQREDDLFRRLLEAALAIPEGEADASIELGHFHLRDAGARGDIDELARARQFYDDALKADEDRPDAAAFRAAVDLILSFAAGAGEDAISAIADDLQRSVRALGMYATGGTPSRALHQIGTWLEFGFTVRSAAAVLSMRQLLDLSAALRALLDVYSDARTRVLGPGGTGITHILRPRIEQWVAENQLSRAALEQLASDLPHGSLQRAAAERLLDVTLDDPGKAPWFRCRPASPGCSGLRISQQPIQGKLRRR
jgi:hypothetical protein